MTAQSPSNSPRLRMGPYVHAQIGDGWEDRRAFIVLSPVRSARCKRRIEAGATLLMAGPSHRYVCRDCWSHHVRGDGRCPLCDRLRMDGPRCRHCAGTGYGMRVV